MRGAGVIYAKVVDTKHRRSPLVQGGLEILITVVIEMDATAMGRQILDRYKQLVMTKYKEPDLNGLFDDCTKDILKELQREEETSDSEEESSNVQA